MEIGQEIFSALGMTLVHSIWQGAVFAAFVMLILMFTGRNNSRMRYIVHFSALLLLLVSFITTFTIVFRNNQALYELQNAVLRLPEGNDLLKALPVKGEGIFAVVMNFFEPFSTWFAIFWLIGFIITGIKMTGGAVASHLMFRRNLMQPDEYVTDLFYKIKQTLQITAPVKLRISVRTVSPMVTGILAPMVIIPTAAISGMSCDQLRAVLIHELAHIKRYDHIFILIQAVARLILFFHPLAWYLLREIDRERENCCDDYVIRNNSNTINYIKALAMIQEMNLPGFTASALTGRKNQLLSRIKRLVKPRTGYSPVFRLSVIALSALIFCAISMAFIITEQPDLKRDGLGRKATAEPSPTREVTAMVIPDGKDGDKKKMVIIFNNDTIKEISVNGKKLSREEMKTYAEDIRKLQRELENSQDEIKRAQRELEDAHRQLELAHRELRNKNLEALKEFKFEFPEKDWKNLGSDPDFHWNSPEFSEHMKKVQEEAWKGIRDEQQALEYLNSEDFKEKMKKAREEMRFAWEQQKELMNSEEFKEEMMKAQQEMRFAWDQQKELMNSEEFKEQMKKASGEVRKALEEFNNNRNTDNELIYHFRELYFQEPPAPRVNSDIKAPEVPEAPEVQKGEFPTPPEAPEVEVEIDVDESVETPEADTGNSEQRERSKEMDTKLRELERE